MFQTLTNASSVLTDATIFVWTPMVTIGASATQDTHLKVMTDSHAKVSAMKIQTLQWIMVKLLFIVQRRAVLDQSSSQYPPTFYYRLFLLSIVVLHNECALWIVNNVITLIYSCVKPLKAVWLEQASQWHGMCCHDLEVVSSNPSRVELGVHITSVLSRTWTKTILSFSLADQRSWAELTAFLILCCCHPSISFSFKSLLLLQFLLEHSVFLFCSRNLSYSATL